MKSSPALLFSAVAATAWAAPVLEERATPKIYLAGNSTMTPGGSGKGTKGASFFPFRHCRPQPTLIQAGANGSTTLAQDPRHQLRHSRPFRPLLYGRRPVQHHRRPPSLPATSSSSSSAITTAAARALPTTAGPTVPAPGPDMHDRRRDRSPDIPYLYVQADAIQRCESHHSFSDAEQSVGVGHFLYAPTRFVRYA